MQLMGSVGRKYKLILTLHDLIYYRHRKPPQDLNLLIRALWRLYHLSYQPQRWLLNRADAVATVSETTKSLIQKHRLTTKPVVVLNNAPDKVVSISARTAPSDRKLIYIGSFMPYKNVETLVRAVGLAPEYELHLLSKITSSRKIELQKLATQSKAQVVFHNGVSDEEYRNLLGQAFALVSASRDEGFGIPLVEAMQVGTPLVVSNLDIFREVAGEAGLFFDSDRPEELAKKLQELEIHDLWLSKSKLGLMQAQKFDWAISAQTLLDQFESLAS
jgi:glycosyltransferase involved in cell wall biosynthesis